MELKQELTDIVEDLRKLGNEDVVIGWAFLVPVMELGAAKELLKSGLPASREAARVILDMVSCNILSGRPVHSNSYFNRFSSVLKNLCSYDSLSLQVIDVHLTNPRAFAKEALDKYESMKPREKKVLDHYFNDTLEVLRRISK